MKRNYKIVMETPMGRRRGALELEITNNVIGGTLIMFNNKETVSGSIDELNICHIHGKIRTLIGYYRYEGLGYIDDENVELNLYGDNRRYHITGKRKLTE